MMFQQSLNSNSLPPMSSFNIPPESDIPMSFSPDIANGNANAAATTPIPTPKSTYAPSRTSIPSIAHLSSNISAALVTPTSHLMYPSANSFFAFPSLSSSNLSPPIISSMGLIDGGAHTRFLMLHQRELHLFEQLFNVCKAQSAGAVMFGQMSMDEQRSLLVRAISATHSEKTDVISSFTRPGQEKRIADRNNTPSPSNMNVPSAPTSTGSMQQHMNMVKPSFPQMSRMRPASLSSLSSLNGGTSQVGSAFKTPESPPHANLAGVKQLSSVSPPGASGDIMKALNGDEEVAQGQPLSHEDEGGKTQQAKRLSSLDRAAGVGLVATFVANPMPPFGAPARASYLAPVTYRAEITCEPSDFAVSNRYISPPPTIQISMADNLESGSTSFPSLIISAYLYDDDLREEISRTQDGKQDALQGTNKITLDVRGHAIFHKLRIVEVSSKRKNLPFCLVFVIEEIVNPSSSPTGIVLANNRRVVAHLKTSSFYVQSRPAIKRKYPETHPEKLKTMMLMSKKSRSLDSLSSLNQQKMAAGRTKSSLAGDEDDVDGVVDSSGEETHEILDGIDDIGYDIEKSPVDKSLRSSSMSDLTHSHIDITDLLSLPQKEAARRLGISESMLCKRFKERTKRKWPYRYLRKIEKVIKALKASRNLDKDERERLNTLIVERDICLQPVHIRITAWDKLPANLQTVSSSQMNSISMHSMVTNASGSNQIPGSNPITIPEMNSGLNMTTIRRNPTSPLSQMQDASSIQCREKLSDNEDDEDEDEEEFDEEIDDSIKNHEEDDEIPDSILHTLEKLRASSAQGLDSMKDDGSNEDDKRDLV
eukprot:TRINITY_DN3526_c0_g3_i1.p1 TRINITY_DN3526_c0_g3~~TRINITY_DN3526_c0_g3_i1.p1  ORF type:complete len:821 (+),score=224.52 TRINITY_DN3526_c0_g3_i1:125-2587(+)